jgi:ABC-type transport system involved in multi-copper enzyme maturation permease subunit
MPFGARSFPERFDALSNELSVIQIVFGFALGSTLLVREIDDGTLNFLDGLPLERSAIFVAKIKAAMLVLTILPLGTLLLNVALHLATRGSLDHALQPFLLLTFFCLSILVTAVGLTAGMLLGFLRYLSWLGSPAPSMTTSSIGWARSLSTASWAGTAQRRQKCCCSPWQARTFRVIWRAMPCGRLLSSSLVLTSTSCWTITRAI